MSRCRGLIRVEGKEGKFPCPTKVYKRGLCMDHYVGWKARPKQQPTLSPGRQEEKHIRKELCLSGRQLRIFRKGVRAANSLENEHESATKL